MRTFYYDYKNCKRSINYFDKISFQIIYMNSNYFAESLKFNSDLIDNLNYKINKITHENNSIKEDNNNLENRINIIEGDNNNLKNRINEITLENNSIKEDNNNLKSRINSIENIVSILIPLLPEEEKKKALGSLKNPK